MAGGVLDAAEKVAEASMKNEPGGGSGEHGFAGHGDFPLFPSCDYLHLYTGPPETKNNTSRRPLPPRAPRKRSTIIADTRSRNLPRRGLHWRLFAHVQVSRRLDTPLDGALGQILARLGRIYFSTAIDRWS